MSRSTFMATTFGLVATAGAAAQCPGGAWSPQFGSAAQSLASASGGASWSDCMVVFDPDGPGAAAGGAVRGRPVCNRGGRGSSRLAKWNGQSWSAVGNGITGRIQALTVFDFDGPGPQLPKLVAAGPFTIGSAGGCGCGRVGWEHVGSAQHRDHLGGGGQCAARV
jgi:hypothetical protein